MNLWRRINSTRNKYKCAGKSEHKNACYFIYALWYREPLINKVLCLQPIFRSIHWNWFLWWIKTLQSIRINHIVAYMQRFHSKYWSAIPHLITKTHCTVKIINQWIWYINNQVRYSLHKWKTDQALLIYEDSHYNALSLYEILKEFIQEKKQGPNLYQS